MVFCRVSSSIYPDEVNNTWYHLYSIGIKKFVLCFVFFCLDFLFLFIVFFFGYLDVNWPADAGPEIAIVLRAQLLGAHYLLKLHWGQLSHVLGCEPVIVGATGAREGCGVVSVVAYDAANLSTMLHPMFTACGNDNELALEFLTLLLPLTNFLGDGSANELTVLTNAPLKGSAIRQR